MKKINAQIIADSINTFGNRITTMLLTYPRFIHSELMTHRMFSRNSASSRAIPFEKMVKMVEEDPFIPIAWQKSHKGMQGTEYLTRNEAKIAELRWLQAKVDAIHRAQMLNLAGVTKQLCNRLLEPFMWHTTLCTFTESENFFDLRCPKYLYDYENDPIYFKSKKDWVNYYNESQDYKENHKEFTRVENLTNLEWLSINTSQAEIHIQSLAEAMWDAMNESKPKQLQAGEWHIPFGDNVKGEDIINFHYKLNSIPKDNAVIVNSNNYRVKIATARCARLSYMTHDGEIDYAKDISLHDQLLNDNHMSPFEHCARAMSDDEYYQSYNGTDLYSFEQYGINNEIESYMIECSRDKNDKSFGWCRNFRGWISYRSLIDK